MASATNFWRTKNGLLILAAICVLALFIALVIVPVISQSMAIASENVSMTLGAIFFVIAVGCYLAAYLLNKKKTAE